MELPLENRQIGIYTIIALVILGVLYGLWAGILDKGTINISGPAPFSVQLDNANPFICQSSSCIFHVRADTHAIVMRKDGYLDTSKVLAIGRGKQIELSADLEKILKVENADEKVTIPKIDNPYTLQTDAKTRVQSLVKKVGDGKEEKEEVIAYFSQPFEHPRMVTSSDDSHVWIIEKTTDGSSVYQIETGKKSRNNIYTTSEDITGIAASQSGKWIAILLANHVDLISISSKMTLTLNATVDTYQQFAWKDDKTFFYMEKSSASQNTSSSAKTFALKRAITTNPVKPDTIQTWTTAEETITQIANDPQKNQLLLKGKSNDYVVAY